YHRHTGIRNSGRESVDVGQVFGERAEVPQAVVGDDHQVLDPHTEVAGQVDPRLDGDDFVPRQQVVGAHREARTLVDVEADPVAEPVAEMLAVAGGVD